MTGHLDAFIPLERTFSKIILEPDAGDDSDLSATPGRSGVLQWSDLLSHHRVIVLSEAGSGKTAEIRNVARQLRAEGKSAFFLRIEYVREL
jgi:Cdc6-like AAA superfamily ATPase